MTDIIIAGGLGDLFIDLTRVFDQCKRGETTGRGKNKQTTPDTHTTILAGFDMNVADIMEVRDYTGRDSDLSPQPAATIVTYKGNYAEYTHVKETRTEVGQKIADTKVAAARLIAEALRPQAEAVQQPMRSRPLQV